MKLNPTRLYYAIFGVLACVYVGPLLIVEHPPAMDLTGHLALATVVMTRGAGDPFSGLFSLPTVPAANTIYYFGVGLMGRVIPIEIASKIFLAAAILATPIALDYALRSAKRRPEIAMAGFALATTFNFIAGFVTFALALPLMLWALGLARRQVEAPTRKRAIILGLVCCLVFFAHAQVFLFTLGLVGLVALLVAPKVRYFIHLAWTIGPGIPSVVLFLPWYLQKAAQIDAAGGHKPKYGTIKHAYDYLPIHTFDQLRTSWDTKLGFAIVFCLLLLFADSVYQRWKSRNEGTEEPWRVRNAYIICAAVAAATYFFLPNHTKLNAVIAGRQAVVAMLLFCACIQVDYKRWLPRVASGATLILVFAYGVLYAQATFAMNREMGNMHALISLAKPRGKLIAPGMPKSKIFRMDIYRHVGSYHAPINHGLVANSFAVRQSTAVRTTKKWHFPRYNAKNPHRDFDNILTSRKLKHDRLKLLGHTGLFYLYEVLDSPQMPSSSANKLE